MEEAVWGKHARFKVYSALKKGGTTAEGKGAKTAYINAKRVAKHDIWLAKSEAEKEECIIVSPDGDGVFRIAKLMDRTNQDVVGENCVCNDAGELALTNEDKMKARVENYVTLLNVKFEWPRNDLPEVSPTAGPRVRDPAPQGTQKCSKAAGPSGIVDKMLKAAGEEGVELARQLTEAVFSCGVITSDCEESFILNLYKGKGEILARGNYSGLKLTDQVIKLLEWISESYNREMVNIDEMQFGSVPNFNDGLIYNAV